VGKNETWYIGVAPQAVEMGQAMGSGLIQFVRHFARKTRVRAWLMDLTRGFVLVKIQEPQGLVAKLKIQQLCSMSY
jgi:hypothetical protein